jgi:hypothetical protein
MTNDYVWISTAMSDGSQLRPFTNDLADNDGNGYLTTDSNKRNDAGESLPLEAFPREIWGAADRGAKTFKNLPDLFYGYGYWVVSERCAGVLRQHDLGNGNLYPVEVFQRDRITPIADHEWFCINFGNVKEVFLPDQSRHIRPFLRTKWHAMGVFTDFDAAVSNYALARPEIWVDPLFNRGLFLSRSLGDHLREEKCSSGWSLKKCRVIPGT